MTSEMEKFQKNPDGTIKVCPVVGYTIFTPLDATCVMRLEFVHSDEELLAHISKGEAPDAVQIGLHPKQALELSESLARAARRAMSHPSDGTLKT